MIKRIRPIIGILSISLLFTGCTVNLGGRETALAEIEVSDENYNQDQGVIIGTFEDENEKILEIQLEDDTAQAYYANDLENFSQLSPGDTVRYLYDDSNTIKELNILQKVDASLFNSEETFQVEEENIDLEDLNEYTSIPLLGYEDIPIEGISIYTDAENNGNQFDFDDTNRFVIVAFSESGEYLLLDEENSNYVPILDVYTIDDQLAVLIKETNTADIKITKYIYEDPAFNGQVIFNEENINLLGSSND